MSIAWISARGNSLANASAIAPEPVPTSAMWRMVGGRGRPPHTHIVQYCFNHVLSLRARNQDCGGDDEIHSPEFLMAGDVLCWNAAGAFGESRVITSLLIGREFAFGMREEVGAIAVQSKHEKEFCVQAWRGSLLRGEARDGGGESLLQLHKVISPQRHPSTLLRAGSDTEKVKWSMSPGLVSATHTQDRSSGRCGAGCERRTAISFQGGSWHRRRFLNIPPTNLPAIAHRWL